MGPSSYQVISTARASEALVAMAAPTLLLAPRPRTGRCSAAGSDAHGNSGGEITMADLLIIDDDTAGAAMLARLLGRDGHEARCAVDVGAALHALREREPDLVLLDVGLPRTDGLTLLDALRDEPQFAGTRVAVYTGRDDEGVREAARRLGACAFIVKGGSWPDMARQIEQCLAASAKPSS